MVHTHAVTHCQLLGAYIAFVTRSSRIPDLWWSQRVLQKQSSFFKKIIKLFECLAHLKRFVKFLEGHTLGKFLHFCTGIDIITCESISITFNTMTGLERRPIAHTCAPLIELPSTYESYLALSEEFLNIIRGYQSWSFDIVWNVLTSW